MARPRGSQDPHAAKEPPEDVTLTVELSRERDDETTVTLRFHRVEQLLVSPRPGEHALHVGGLRCVDRGSGREARARFEVQDRWGDSIAFRCGSFEEARRDAGTQSVG